MNLINTKNLLKSTYVILNQDSNGRYYDYDQFIIKIIKTMKEQQAIPIKLVVVGDNGISKLSLIQSFLGTYNGQYQPNVFDNYVTCLKLDGKFIQLGLWDTAGAQQYNRLRPLAYPNADIMVICFSVVQRSSFVNVLKRVCHFLSKWIPEIKQNIFIQRVSLMIVGLYTQKRKQYLESQDEKKRKQVVSQKQARQAIQKQLNLTYMQCSPSKNENVENIIHECIRRALKKKVKPFIKKRENKKCYLI